MQNCQLICCHKQQNSLSEFFPAQMLPEKVQKNSLNRAFSLPNRPFCYFYGQTFGVMDIGSKIRKFRELKSITREAMADEMQMSLSGYSKIERNEVDLTLSRIQQIARILGVDVSQILNFDASQIFNLTENHTVQGSGAKARQINFYGDEYKDKYIKMLEEENARLKTQLGSSKKND